jgi:hypothetical protein
MVRRPPERIETGQRVRQLERIVHRYDEDARSEPDVLGHRGGPGERDKGIEEVGGRVVLCRRMDDVITDPQVEKAQFLGVSRRPRDRVGTSDPPILR